MFRVCLLSLSLVVFAWQIRAEMISTAVGVVKARYVTSREVQIVQLLETALYKKGPKEGLVLLGLDSKAFHHATQDVLLECAVALEAQSFNITPVSIEELHEASARAIRTLAPSRAWQGLEVSKTELEGDLKRKLQAKKFVNFRAQSSILPVSDVDAQRYFNENQGKFANLPFENFKEDIKSYLSRTQVERRLKDWYDVLLSKYQVKNLIAEM